MLLGISRALLCERDVRVKAFKPCRVCILGRLCLGARDTLVCGCVIIIIYVNRREGEIESRCLETEVSFTTERM